MPITYAIDHERRLVRVTPSGCLTEDEMFGYQADVWQRPDVAGYDEFIDMSNVTQLDQISPERVHALAQYSAKMDHPQTLSKLAIVANEDLHYGLGRMYGVLRDGSAGNTKKVQVFRTADEAEAWLGQQGE